MSSVLNRQIPNICVDGDVLDIARRIVEGDEVWRGDENMTLTINPETGMFEVMALDGTGAWYCAYQSTTCDTSILVGLARGDWQRGRTLLAEREAERTKAQKDREDREREERAERILRYKYDLGHAVGEYRPMFGQINKPTVKD